MIQLAKPEGPSEQGKAKKELTASHFPLVPGKLKQRNAEIKKHSDINKKKEGDGEKHRKGIVQGGGGSSSPASILSGREQQSLLCFQNSVF